MDRSNQDWVTQLDRPGPQQDKALSDLRPILVRGLTRALQNWRSTSRREFRELVEDFVQDALLKILDGLSSFEGRSRFTTWAYKIAVRVALTELRRKKWEDVSLDDLTEESSVGGAVASDRESPENQAVESDLVQSIHRIMGEELSSRQLQAMNAVVFGAMPLEEVARRMDTNRNALYKLLYDGRVSLKRRLEREGISPTIMDGG